MLSKIWMHRTRRHSRLIYYKLQHNFILSRETRLVRFPVKHFARAFYRVISFVF